MGLRRLLLFRHRKLAKAAPTMGSIRASILAVQLAPCAHFRVQRGRTKQESALVLLRRSSLRADDGQKVGSFRSLAKKRVEEFAAAIPV
jgi:hypothetical protein